MDFMRSRGLMLESPEGDAPVRGLAWASLALCFAALAGYEAFSRWQRRRLELRDGR
jgi:hypothetical protein